MPEAIIENEMGNEPSASGVGSTALKRCLGSVYSPKQNNFNFFRLLFASLVVFSHSYTLLLGAGHLDPLATWLLHRQMDLAGIGVEGFFAISGFLVLQSWFNSSGILSFAAKRFLRIYPGYLAAMIFCLAIILPLSGTPTFSYLGHWTHSTWSNVLGMGVVRGSIFNNYAFLKNPVAGFFNGALWTIPFEARCYCIVGGLGVLGLLRYRGIVPLLFTGTYFYYNLKNIIETINPRLVGISGPSRVTTYFFAGAMVYLFRDKIPLNRTLLILALLATGISCFAARSWIMPISGTYLLFYAATSPRLKLSGIGRKVDLSYGIYLYGFPVMQLLIAYYKERLTPLLLFTCVLSLASALAFLSWTLVESPALKLKRLVKP